ncbi:hypothetical protein [Pasteuria penetrans]|uniref:hypothetical protein n=1 Tax=Pasteuria penetrans TaxID=86005 RepID=UPI000FA6BF94|nr:hypothetical protein [Pasteuria penetrans]
MDKFNENLKYPPHRVWSSVFVFVFLGIFFHMMMLVHAWSVIWGKSDFVYLLIYTLGFSILFLFSLLQAGGSSRTLWEEKGRWYYIRNQLFMVGSYRKKCFFIYKNRGFSSFRWYFIWNLGPAWFLTSLLLYYYLEPVWESNWLLTAGILGWCIFLKLQVMQERKWCSGAGRVDDNFINIRIFHFLILYLVPIHLFSIFGSYLPPYFQASILILLISQCSNSIFPAWLHIYLGQRTTPDLNFRFWTLLDFYGDFGNNTSNWPGSPRKNNIIDILCFFGFLCFIFGLFLWFILFNYFI